MVLSFSLRDVKYLADEVNRQGDPAIYVAGMANALLHARLRNGPAPRHEDVEDLAWAVKMGKLNGYRRVPVVVGGSSPIEWANIPSQMESLLANWDNDELTDEEWYREFEEIHPFVDGNGRVGSILYNWRRGSLNEPVSPPDFWGKKSD